MTGAGTVQTGSASDFEILYAGYRWDGESPQMYYVRNRFLLPVIGTWNKRDPLGYVDGMGLYRYVGTVNAVDWDGLKTREEWFSQAVSECATKLCRGGFKFLTKDTELPPGFGESTESLENNSQIYTIRPFGKHTYCSVLDDVYKEPGKYGTTCGRTSSLILYCAIRNFYTRSGACKDGHINRMTSLLELTSSAELANNQNSGLPLKETNSPKAGSFCIWVNPNKVLNPYWQHEGAICIKPDYFYAPGITNCNDREDTLLTPTSEIEKKMNTTDKRCFDVDLDALDKLSGCSSHKAAENFEEWRRRQPTPRK